MSRIYTTPGGINPQPRTLLENNRNWQLLAKLLLAGVISVGPDGALVVNTTPPLDSSGSALALNLAAAGGLTVISGELSVLLDPTNPCLQLTTGLKVTINATGAITQTSTGLAVAVDNTTLAIATDTLQVKAGGIGLAQLGALTTKGDLLGFSTAHVRVAVGADGAVLTADSSQTAGVKWATPLISPLTTKGDVWVWSTTNARLAVGGDGSVLTADSAQSTGLKWANPSNGTVSSVALSEGVLFTVSGSPVTTTGTLTLTLKSAAANNVFAGPTTGASAAPAFRALVAGDIPGTLANTTIPTLTISTGITYPNQTANFVWAGPTTGSAAAPAFRALVAADIPATLANTTIPVLTISTNLVNATDGNTLGATTLTNAATGNVGLVINGKPFTSVNLQEWRLNSALKASMDSSGLLTTVGLTVSGSVNLSNANLTIATVVNAGTSGIPLTVNGVTGTTADLQDWQVNGVQKANLTANGTLNLAATLGSAAMLPGGNWIGNTSGQTVGTSFNVSAADGVFQDTGIAVTLPSAGTYLVYATVRAILSCANVGGTMAAELFNATDSAAVANSETMIVTEQLSNSAANWSAAIIRTITVAASKSIKIYGMRNSGGTYGVSQIASDSGGRTVIGYVRIA